jgi:ferredoxin
MTEERWRLAVDHTKCIASGLCEGSRPDRFQIADGKSSPLADEVEPDGELLDVAETCPTEAISVYAPDGTLLAPEL